MNTPQVHPVMVEPLARSTFEPFGTVIAPESLDSPRFNRAPGNFGVLWVQKELAFPGRMYMCCLRYYYRGMICEFVQRHPSSTITLIPMGRRPSIIVVAPPGVDDSGPTIESIRAFELNGDAGVVVHKNTWLRYAYPMTEFVDFAYVTQRVDPATANTTDDTERYLLAEHAGAVVELRFGPPKDAELGPSGEVVSLPIPQPPEH
jgi:ureidoglycolate hydrolase